MDHPPSDMLADFVSDCGELSMCIEANILEFERDRDNPRPDLIAELFRAMHSLKGNAGLMGFTAIRSLAHEAESLLSQYREGTRQATSKELELLLDCNDMLRTLIEHIESDTQPSITGLLDALQCLTNPQQTTEQPVPVQPVATAPATLQPVPQAHAAPQYAIQESLDTAVNSKILLIDNDPSSMKILKARFAKIGIEVDSASDGADAITRVCQSSYQIVITDVNLPGMTGADLTMLIKRRRPFTQIVVHTADSASSAIAKCMAYGACDFFLKDEGMQRLVSAIPAILDRAIRWADGPMRREMESE